MMRTQIQLEQSQHKRLQEIAHRRGVSLSAVIRNLIEEKLLESEVEGKREDQVRAALAVCGKYVDPEGRKNVAENHDRFLAEAMGR